MLTSEYFKVLLSNNVLKNFYFKGPENISMTIVSALQAWGRWELIIPATHMHQEWSQWLHGLGAPCATILPVSDPHR